MAESESNGAKKEGSLGAWLETREAVKRLCVHYPVSRVKMLHYIVDAFERLSAAYNHRLILPVEFDNLNIKTIKLPRGESVKNLSPKTKRQSRQSQGSSADAGKNQ